MSGVLDYYLVKSGNLFRGGLLEVFDEAQRFCIEIKIGLDLWDSPKPFILDEENLGLEKISELPWFT